MCRKVLPWLAIIAMLFSSFTIDAQKQTPLDAALRHVEQKSADWGLLPTDIQEIKVSHQFQSKHNLVTHYYLLQHHNNIEVEGAIIGVHIMSDGKVGYSTNRFVPALGEKVQYTVPTIDALSAIQQALSRLDLPSDNTIQFKEKLQENSYVFTPGKAASTDIRVQLLYWPRPGSEAVELAWRVHLQESSRSLKVWDILVSAQDGKILHQRDRVHRSKIPGSQIDKQVASCRDEEPAPFRTVTQALEEKNAFPPLAGETYNVFPIPLANPLQGARQLVISPADPTASPFGWHDTDGQAGAEYTITRGNNVYAYHDRNGNDVPSGDEPDGGSSLQFDFPLDLSQEPDTYTDAAVTQLFYINNFMHDFAYAYGFDEAAGNFQQNNYGNGGMDGDALRAHAQDFGADPYREPADPSDDQVNNANFFTPLDGFSPVMQMYLFDRQGNDLFTVLDPEPIRGAFETGIATFGPSITATPIEGRVVNAVDNSNSPSLLCSAVSNSEEVNGNIAMIDRGECFFKEKTINAQQAGAIAVIICNFEDVIIDMGGPASIDEPVIPTLMLKNTDCQTIRNFIAQGVDVKLQQPDISGPTFVDSDFDTEVIVHEYGHGISNRLTGGANSNCLNNDEQMGEGWSDFFSLVTTVKPGEDGTEPKHVGSYVWTRTASGTGVRRLPYSFDMSVNNQTFADIIGTGGRVFNPAPGQPGQRGGPHSLGEIWTGVLWDLYWAMVEEYDFDEDMINGTGGNNMAIQLVMDGMKLQACNPGFLDGRDAILMADQMTYGGVNQCLIWEVFARRGMGFGADQGSINDRNDLVESFQTNPTCIPTVKIAKAATPLINPGDEINYTIEVYNHKPEAISGVVVNDILPDGTTYVTGSATGTDNVDLSGNQITFEIGEMAAGDTVVLTYDVFTAAELKSTQQFFDDVESADTEVTWIFDFLDGTTIWEVNDNEEAFSGQRSWSIANTNTDNDQILFLASPFRIEGTQPALRFYHRYDTETGFDGGFVEVSTDGGSSWESVAQEKYFRGGDLRPLNYSTFAIPGIEAFSGTTDGEFVPAYIDLSDYIGQDIQVRFRFGSDDVESRDGWYIDDIEILDVFNYQSEVCVTSNEGDQACATAPERGTVVNDQTVLPTTEIESLGAIVSIFPNPARNVINIAVTTETSSEVAMELFSMDGKQILRQRDRITVGAQQFQMDVSDLPSGFYMVRLQTDLGATTQKIIIE
ncbi:MAG: DUF11 domain-containing protein [Saprospiraceae bacterium]|nr:DUF11 domain-containing protein [Saprospiraceae bacterium]